MEPYLILVNLFSLFGLGEFALEYKHILYSWLVMALLIILGFLTTKSLKLIPSKAQNFFEVAVSGLEDFMVDVTGEEGRQFFPFVATIFIYVLTCNLIGVIPGFYPPTANLNTTLSMALLVFIYTHYLGIKYHGIKYIKHFLGPIWWMAWIIFPIELVSHFARILSLSFRLFGNMMGHELVLAIICLLAGAFFAPLPIMGLGVFVCFIQAFIFFLLSTIYFAGAMEEAH